MRLLGVTHEPEIPMVVYLRVTEPTDATKVAVAKEG